jgi:type I restriction enzyme, S subunit
MKWPRKTIAEVATLTYGYTESATEQAVGPKFLRITDIRGDGVQWSTVPYCTIDDCEREKFSLRSGDIVFARTGATTGKSYLIQAPPDAVFASYLIRLRVSNPDLHPPYLAHFFNTVEYWRAIASGTTGSAQGGFNASKLGSLQIPLPPVAEQKQIASILDAADVLRAKRRESIEQLESLLQATFLEMFGDPVTNPKEWNDSVLLGDVADITSGLTKGRKLRNQSTREVPYLAVVNVQDRHLVLDPLKTIEATNAEIDKYRLLRNDLLLTEGGDRDKLGRGTLWQDELPECIHQNHIFRVRLHDERWVPVFLNWLAGSNRGKRYFLSQAKQTTGIASINLSQLKRFPLLLPPLHLQQRFASIVEAIESHKVRLKTQYAEIDALFASLQVRAFSGDLCSSAVSRQHASA